MGRRLAHRRPVVRIGHVVHQGAAARPRRWRRCRCGGRGWRGRGRGSRARARAWRRGSRGGRWRFPCGRGRWGRSGGGRGLRRWRRLRRRGCRSRRGCGSGCRCGLGAQRGRRPGGVSGDRDRPGAVGARRGVGAGVGPRGSCRHSDQQPEERRHGQRPCGEGGLGRFGSIHDEDHEPWRHGARRSPPGLARTKDQTCAAV